MRRLMMPMIVLSAVLALVPAAEAKGPVEAVDVCGNGDDCTSVPISPGSGLAGPMGLDKLLARPVAAVPPAQAFVSLHVTFGGGTMDMYYVPHMQVIFNQGWSKVSPPVGDLLDAAAARVKQRQPQLATVSVGNRISSDPGAYTPLLRSTLAPAAEPADAGARSFTVLYSTTETTPWTPRGTGYATYFPSGNLIRSGLSWYHMPSAMASQLHRDIGTTATGHPAAGGGGLSRWWLLLPGVIAAAAVVTVLIRRRKGRPRPLPVA